MDGYRIGRYYEPFYRFRDFPEVDDIKLSVSLVSGRHAVMLML